MNIGPSIPPIPSPPAAPGSSSTSSAPAAGSEPAGPPVPASPARDGNGSTDTVKMSGGDGQTATRVTLRGAGSVDAIPAGPPPAVLDGLTRDQVLEKRLKDALKNAGLKEAGAVVMDLERGVFAGQNEGAAYSPASVIKVPVMIEVMKQVEAGKLAYTGNVKSLVERMIIHSDNAATNELIRMVDPSHTRITATMHEILGNRDIQLHNEMFPGSYKRLNQGSARAFATLIKRIDEGKVISPEVSARMKAIMGRNADDSMLGTAVKVLGSDARLYNKTGSHGAALNDAGIIEFGDRRLVLAIFTREKGNETSNNGKIVQAATELLQAFRKQEESP